MKTLYIKYILSLFIVILFLIPGKSQKISSFNSFEFIFSWANVEKDGNSVPDIPRFTIWFNYGRYWDFNINKYFGLQSGICMKNVGMITRENYSEGEDYLFQDSQLGARNHVKTKRRTYNLGIPLLIKIGSFDKHVYFYAGGEYEWAFHYKQKYFVNGAKHKETDWFSDRNNSFLPSIVAGFQLPKGFNIRFKYYLDDFMNENYSFKDANGIIHKPYSNMESRIFYISLMFNFKDNLFKKISDEDETIANARF